MKTMLLITVCALTAFGQPHPSPMPMPGPRPGGGGEFFAWWDSPIVKDLKVTDEQQKQIKTIVHDYRNKLIDLRAAVEKTDGNLNDILNEDKIDMKRATDAVDKMATAKADLNRNLTLMSVSLRAVLTTEQWKELQKRQPHPDRMMSGRQRRSMQGPGMPGPMPMNGPWPNRNPNQGPNPNQGSRQNMGPNQGPNAGPQNRPGNPQPQQQQPQPPPQPRDK